MAEFVTTHPIVLEVDPAPGAPLVTPGNPDTSENNGLIYVGTVPIKSPFIPPFKPRPAIGLVFPRRA